jgi:iron complex transport system substrate-binding protein
MDRPPSVQRVLAVKWLGNLLYPDLFDYDMIAETQTFYQLFFHCTLTEAEVRTLLENSTYREW